MNGSMFEAIRDRVDVQEVAARYGVRIIRGKALCPFHHDTHPSMTFKNDRFRCWVCGEHGDAIDLTGKLLGLAPKDAAAQINQDFVLGLDTTQRAGQAQVQQWERDKRAVEAFDRWERATFQTLVAYSRQLEHMIQSRAPVSPEDGWPDEWCAALHERPKLEGMLDALTYGEFADKLAFFKNYRNEVQAIERYIQGSTNAKPA